jgi:DNA recombination protein RmuC
MLIRKPVAGGSYGASMSTSIAFIAAAVALGALILSLRRSSPDVAAIRREMNQLTERIGADNSLLAGRLEGLDNRLAQGQAASQGLAVDIFDTLGDLRASTSAVAEQAKEFTTLQQLLRAPKARGGLGEAMLEQLLGQVLPPDSFEMQHRFSDGVIVDAVVKAGGRLVCIDSKFPMANYQRICDATDDIARAEAERAFAADVTQHVKAIQTRYIVPDEKTLDFAVMYVPAEGVYAEVLRSSSRRGSVFETALESRVVPMSPLTLFGYLQTVLYGLRCMRIEEHAETILGLCGRLEQDLTRFAEDYDTLGRHLVNARGRYEDGARKLDRVRDRLERLGAGETSPGPHESDEHLRGPEALEIANGL